MGGKSAPQKSAPRRFRSTEQSTRLHEENQYRRYEGWGSRYTWAIVVPFQAPFILGKRRLLNPVARLPAVANVIFEAMRESRSGSVGTISTVVTA